ncbi:MAG: hypothetical protein F6K21_03760 [Symploca sp. SIO2D2]|nr:hypothetical protein [Symploca sp. SIO2D2]
MDITNRKTITVVRFALEALLISTVLLVATVACQSIKSDNDTENKISNINQKEFVNPYFSNAQYYNTPSIQAKKDSLLIEGKGQPAGLFLTYKLEPNKRYRVKVTGHSQQGQTTLRVRRDENEPDYSLAPDGTTDFVLLDVEEVEFLLYNDQAFAYELNSIQIEECPTCKTDKDLRQILLTEIPDLNDTENKISNINQKELVNPYFSNAQYYNTPSIQAKKESLLIEGKGQPAGLFLTYKLEPNKRYRVKVTGHSQQGQTTLRVRQDENKPDYSIAPDGSTDFVLFDVEEVEFLLYSDQAFAYHLNSLQIEECPTCKTDEDLRQMLLTEIPELRESLKNNRLHAARLLLHWSSNVSDFALSSEIDKMTGRQIASMSAADIYYNIFQANAGAVYCGGLATFYDKILKLFDYNSFVVNYGDLRNDLTHVTVIVASKQSNDWNYYVFDPTFNATFHHRYTGKYATVFDIIELTQQDRLSQLVVKNDSLSKRDYTVLKNENDKCEILKFELKDWLICEQPSFGIVDYLDSWEKQYIEQGYSGGVKGFMELLTARFFSVGSSLNPDASQQFISEIKSLEIPYGRN